MTGKDNENLKDNDERGAIMWPEAIPLGLQMNGVQSHQRRDFATRLRALAKSKYSDGYAIQNDPGRQNIMGLVKDGKLTLYLTDFDVGYWTRSKKDSKVWYEEMIQQWKLED